MRLITRAAALGAGTMGSRLAAHLANAGISTLLLDLPGLARPAWEALPKQKPAALFVPDFQNRITVGDFDQDLDQITTCDWIIGAVAENVAIKRRLLERVAPRRAPHAVVSTNTSGIPVAAIANGFPDEFRRH